MDYVDAAELSRRTGLSVPTIFRLKLAGKIPFFQPGGKDHRVLFPADAIEKRNQTATEATAPPSHGRELVGPLPAWMRTHNPSDPT
jgi:hypothetical protein